ncbi:hypothetical protein GCM10009096_30300 [Parasphingorhabdus litoris]|uniref:Lipoprotein n=1 Tax=Parasphingorhabdus litoris TaxID=394733 RepID=A0ABN1AWX4_9SPHN|nr:hypothetical protein [Parasphingorhabdus litoris]
MPRKSRFVASAILATCLTLSACGSADDEDSLTGAFTKGFDESWNSEFVAGCVTESKKAGATEADATPICTCLAKELDKSLDGISEKMNPPEAKLEAASEICLGEL